MRAISIALSLVLGLFAIEACRAFWSAPRAQMRRARETHRLAVERPRTAAPTGRSGRR